jgi:hypothetical protein
MRAASLRITAVGASLSAVFAIALVLGIFGPRSLQAPALIVVAVMLIASGTSVPSAFRGRGSRVRVRPDELGRQRKVLDRKDRDGDRRDRDHPARDTA